MSDLDQIDPDHIDPDHIDPDHIYLDHNATTPLSPRAFEAMRPFFGVAFGNPSSRHALGRQARAAIEEARARVAALLSATPAEITFSSGGTEADNLAIFGALHAARSRGRHVIATPLEHPAVLNTLRRLEALGALTLTLLSPESDGHIAPQTLAGALTPSTALVCIMAAHNELGTLNPIAELARLTHRCGALFHCDATQAVGKVPLDVAALDVDTLALSAHKFYGPKGVGALYVRRGLVLQPLFSGGGQEQGLRSGTENVPSIVGMGVAAEESAALIPSETPRLIALREHLFDGLVRLVPNLQRNTPSVDSPQDTLPNTLHVSFLGHDALGILTQLDALGFALSAGSACHATTAPSKTSQLSGLGAVGISGPARHGAIRFSLGRSNTREDIDALLECFPRVLKQTLENTSKNIQENTPEKR